MPIFSGLDVTFAPAETADYVVCSGLFDDTRETPDDYRELLGGDARPLAVHGLRQSRHRGRARRGSHLLRRRARRRLRRDRRRGAVLRQAVRADLRGRARSGGARSRRRSRRRSTGCWRSAIQSGPISRARPCSASIACLSYPAFMPPTSGARERDDLAGSSGNVRRCRRGAESGDAQTCVVRR